MNRRVRVLYIIGTLGVGGAEGHLVQVLRHLDRDRFDPMVACLSEFGPLEAEVRSLDVPLHLYGLKGLRNVPPLEMGRRLWSMAKHVRQVKPDIVHTYLFWANVLGGILSRLGGAPVLITSRRGIRVHEAGRLQAAVLGTLANLVTDAVTVNSRMVERDVLVRERFVRGKIHRMYNGVEWERFAQPNRPRAAVREELGLPSGARVVGCVANLIPYKGHADLLQALAQVAREVPSVRLVLVGEDRGILEGLESLARQLGIADLVHFTGPRADVPDLLHAFDLFALASHEEGFSNVILEAMAAGLPVVATAVGGNAEAVVEGETGYIVEPRDPGAIAEGLLRVLRDPDKAAEMGRAGQNRVREEFSPAAMVRAMEGLYRRVLSHRYRGVDTGRSAQK